MTIEALNSLKGLSKINVRDLQVNQVEARDKEIIAALTSAYREAAEQAAELAASAGQGDLAKKQLALLNDVIDQLSTARK